MAKTTASANTEAERERKRAANRAHKRAQRMREGAGMGLFKIELDRAALEDALVERGLLDPSVADDQRAQEKALMRLLQKTLLGHA